MFARLKTSLQSFRLYRAARFGWHFACDPVFRRDHLLLWRRPPNLFQHRSITTGNRYAPLFRTMRDLLAGRPAPRLLSFGCAMGDEVFTLHRYFPTATIKGLDINPANIVTATARHRAAGANPALRFEVAGTAAAETPASYDAVFCLSVFVRWRLKEDRAIATCAPILHFADFARASAELAACVRPGGFLVIRHAMFRFADTPAARDFRPGLLFPHPPGFFPRFGPDNRRLPDEPFENAVFERLPSLPPAAG